MLQPGSTWLYEYTPDSITERKVILFRSAVLEGPVAEVSVVNQYPDEDLLLVSGFLISMLSFIIIGVSVKRQSMDDTSTTT